MADRPTAATPRPTVKLATLLLVFLLAGVGLSYEIALTRIFALRFQYHYAFLAVAVAVGGLSLGAAATQWWSPAPGAPANDRRADAWLLLALLFSLVGLGLAWLPLAALLPHLLLALGPFLLLGFVLTDLFISHRGASGLLYGADLLGAATGVVLVVVLLHWWSPFTLIYGFSALLAAGALYQSPRHQRWRSGVVGLIALVLVLLNLTTGWADFDPRRLLDPPRDKTMLAILNDPAQTATLERTLWSPFARVDVVTTADPTAKFVFTDGGAGSYMLRFTGDLATVADQQGTPAYLPFATGAVTQTLILGAGAGKDVVLALLGGAQQITAVEVNAATVAATRADARYNGNILDLPNVQTVIGDARTFVERSNVDYNVIYLNLVYTQAADPLGQALVENYVFTTEAFQGYWQRLAADGRLAVVTHNALEGSRAMITALQALAELGLAPPQALDHMALWVMPATDPTLRTTVFLLSKHPLTPVDKQQLGEQAVALGMQPFFMPGDAEGAFAPLRQGMGLGDFVQEDAAYNLSPTTDDRPFFFQLDPGLPTPIRWALQLASGLAGLLLAGAFFTTTGGSSGGTPRTGHRLANDGDREQLPRWLALLYAALIGLAFMLLEVALLQGLQLLLGAPIFSLAVVLGALLIGGGCGSLLSQRWRSGQLRTRLGPVLWLLVLMALLYALGLSFLVQRLLPLAFPFRVGAAILLSFLPGLLLGIPFPALLRLAPPERSVVAWLWSINGAFSVLGSTLAMALAMTGGFRWAYWSGALLYAGLALLLWLTARKPEPRVESPG